MSTDPSAGGAGGEPLAGAAGAPGNPGAPGGAGGAGGQPSEEELRAAYEAELARVTSTEVLLQTAVSLLNLGSFRLAPTPPGDGAGGVGGAPPSGAGQDLEQARDAIDAVRALLEILERRVPSELRPLREAVSQLQMVYAREVQAAGEATPGGDKPGSGGERGGSPDTGSGTGGHPSGTPGSTPGEGSGDQRGGGAPEEQPDPRRPGPAESSGRLWVPGR